MIGGAADCVGVGVVFGVTLAGVLEVAGFDELGVPLVDAFDVFGNSRWRLRTNWVSG